MKRRTSRRAKPPGRSPARTAMRRVSTVALLVLIVALGAATWGVVTGQWRAHSVLSGSMEPRLPVGSVAITERVRTSSLMVGDVVTFREPDNAEHLITHRIASITKSDGRLRYETKGDANDSKDPWLVTLRGQYSYRVMAHVPYVGYVVTAARDPGVRPWLLGGAGALLLLAVVNLFRPDRGLHDTRRRPTPGPAGLAVDGGEATEQAKEMAR